MTVLGHPLSWLIHEIYTDIYWGKESSMIFGAPCVLGPLLIRSWVSLVESCSKYNVKRSGRAIANTWY
jgi:hypothetical protein